MPMEGATLQPQAAALCVVEMQNDMVHESNVGQRGIGAALAGAVQERGVIPRLAAVIQAARSAKVPVFYINVALRPDLPRPNTLLHRRAQRRPTLIAGTWGALTHEALAPQEGDFVLERTVGIDGSYGTQLYPLLRLLRRSQLVVAGVSTNLAVEGLVRASVNRNFEVFVIEDCCASYPPEWHRFSVENILPLISTVTNSEAVLHCFAALAATTVPTDS